MQIAQQLIEHPSFENLEESKSSQKGDSADYEECISDGDWACTSLGEYYGIEHLK